MADVNVVTSVGSVVVVVVQDLLAGDGADKCLLPRCLFNRGNSRELGVLFVAYVFPPPPFFLPILSILPPLSSICLASTDG